MDLPKSKKFYVKVTEYSYAKGRRQNHDEVVHAMGFSVNNDGYLLFHGKDGNICAVFTSFNRVYEEGVMINE